MSTDSFIFCDNLVKIYKVADLEVVALQGLDLAVAEGEMMALVGASGSGKSTLLNVIGGLDEPSAGKISVNGQDLLKISDKERVLYKRNAVGFVWQQPARNLLPYLTAQENVELPMMLMRRQCTAAAESRLGAFGDGQSVGTEPTFGQIASLAGSSSALPSPSPWRTIPPCCWQMSQRGR